MLAQIYQTVEFGRSHPGHWLVSELVEEELHVLGFQMGRSLLNNLEHICLVGLFLD